MPKHRPIRKTVQMVGTPTPVIPPEQEKRLWKILGEDASNPETPEQKYDQLVAPILTDVAARVKGLGMSIIALVDYGEPTDLATGVSLSMQDVVSPMFMLAMLAARSGGNFDTLVSLLRQVNPSHNSVVLSLLGFPMDGVKPVTPPNQLADELQTAWRLLRDHSLMNAASIIEGAIQSPD